MSNIPVNANALIQPQGCIPWKQDALWLLVIAILPFLLYAPSLGYPLLFLDDSLFFTAEGNPLTRNGTPTGLATIWTGTHYGYTPITHLTIWLDQWLGGSTLVSRLHSILWFSSGSLAVYALITRLTRSSRLGLVVALLYAVHPLSAPTCLWLALRRQGVCLSLLWWSLHWYLACQDGIGSRVRSTTFSLVFFAAAALSRFLGVIAAPMAAAFHCWPGIGLRRPGLLLALMAAGAAAFCCISLAIADETSLSQYRLGGTIAGTLLLDGQIVLASLVHVVWPWNLTTYYGVNESLPYQPLQLLAWPLVVLIVTATLVGRKHRREIAVLWILALISMAPTLNLINQYYAMADHYIQPALPFILLILVRSIATVVELASSQAKLLTPVGLTTLACLYLAPAAVIRNLHFSSNMAYSLQAVKVCPASGFLWAQLHNNAVFSDQPAIEELTRTAALKAVSGSDFHRACIHDSFACLAHAGLIHISNGTPDKAHTLVDLHSQSIGPWATTLLRAMYALEEGKPRTSIRHLEPLLKNHQTAIDTIWSNSHQGQQLPSYQLDRIRGQSNRWIVGNVLDATDQDRLWVQRTLIVLAQAYGNTGQDLAAAKAALAALSIDPNQPHAWSMVSLTFDKIGLLKQAAVARQAYMLSRSP